MRVHTCIKKLSAALAVTMALSLAAGLPAMAEDNGSSAPSSSASAPASAASNAPKTGDSAAAGSGGSSSSTAPTPTPAPDYSGEAPYVANYTLKNAAGNIGNLVRDKNNDVIPTGTLTVTVVDKRLQGVSALGGKPITQDQVRLIPQNGVTFSAQEGSVSNIKSDSYDVTFVGLQYLGGENTRISLRAVAERPVRLTITVGDHTETAVAEAGDTTLELSFPKQLGGRIRIKADGEVLLDNVKLYTHVTEGGIYGLSGEAGPYLEGIRALNRNLAGS